MSNVSAVTNPQRELKKVSNNLQGEGVLAFKQKVVSYSASEAGGAQTVNMITRTAVDKQGELSSTNNVLDLALDGNGMLIVSDSPDGQVSFTRVGNFSQDKLGFWRNGPKMYLHAQKYDREGNLPQDKSQLSGLEAVNFANMKGSPKATTFVSIAANLNAKQKSLRGAGPENGFSMKRLGKNKSTKASDILLPDRVGNKSLRIGDQMRFKSADGEEMQVEYGGIAQAKKPSGTNPIFGSSSSSKIFTFSQPQNAGAGKVVDGEQFRITVGGGQVYTFTASQGKTTGMNFNSIRTLANAINKISGLSARVEDDRLYIAPKDANKSIAFGNVGGSTIVDTLGLQDIGQAVGEIKRFNSIEGLRDVINRDQADNSLRATIEDDDIKITSLLATSALNLRSTPVSGNKISRAVVNPGDRAQDQATVYIEAKDSDLRPGEFVRLKGMVAAVGALPDAVYMVGSADENGFTVNIVDDAPANYNLANATLNPADATWERAAGVSGEKKEAAITRADVGGGPQTIRIDLNAHNLNVNDIIYVEGGSFNLNIENVAGGGPAMKTIILPSGYYAVTNVGGGGNFFEITATDADAAVPGAVASDNGVSFRKIEGSNGVAIADVAVGGGPFNTNIFTSGAAAGSTSVTYHLGGGTGVHGYSVGSVIKFKDLPNPHVIDNINLYNDIEYIVSAVNENGITFDANSPNLDGNPAGAALAGGQSQGLNVAGLRETTIDSSARLLEYFKVDPKKEQYDEVYNASVVEKNLSNGAFKTGVETYPLQLVDSEGFKFTVLMNFAKLDNNKWAVEIAAQKNDEGVYDITNLLGGNVIKSGTLEFDRFGEFLRADGFDDKLEFQRTNDTEPMRITVDWENKLGDVKSVSLTQTNAKTNFESIQSDGRSTGILSSVNISPDGIVSGTFSNGEVRNLYKIPVATFANINGLKPGKNSTYSITGESGDLLIKDAGEGGAAKIVSGALELSTVDKTEQIVNANLVSQNSSAAVKVIAVNNEMQKNAINNI